MADRFTLEFEGVPVRFVWLGEGEVVAAAFDLMEAAGFASPSSVVGRCEESSDIDKAFFECPDLGADPRYRSKKAIFVDVAADTVFPFLATTTRQCRKGGKGLTGDERRDRIGRLATWLPSVRPPIEAPKSATPPPVTPTPEEQKATPPPPAPAPSPIEPGEVLIGEVIGQGQEARRLVRARDWSLTQWTGRGEDEPRIRDLDLAERLGYAQPRDIRKLIKRLIDENRLSGVYVRATVARTQMPTGGFREDPVEEYWLTERQAMKVATQSKTPNADAITDEMIDVYSLAVRGLLPQQQPKPPTPQMENRSTADVMLELSREIKASLEAAKDLDPKRVSEIHGRMAEAHSLLLLREAREASKEPVVFMMTPREAQKKYGIPEQTFGRIAGALGLKGPYNGGIPGVSVPFPDKADNGQPITRFRYSMEVIEKQILPEWRATGAAKVVPSNDASRVARVGAGDKGEVFIRLDDEDAAE